MTNLSPSRREPSLGVVTVPGGGVGDKPYGVIVSEWLDPVHIPYFSQLEPGLGAGGEARDRVPEAVERHSPTTAMVAAWRESATSAPTKVAPTRADDHLAILVDEDLRPARRVVPAE